MRSKFILLTDYLKHATRWRAVAAFCLPFFLYMFTLAPTIYNLDSAELTTAVATDGLLRATGYPLYLLLGRLWILIPVGDMGYRMNLFSAFSGALTLLFVDRILYHIKVSHGASLIALGLLATAPFFWSLSLVAEVYTLHTALMGLIILLLLRWGRTPSPKVLFSITLAIGLSMGHHLATALLVPGAVWYVCTTCPRKAFTPQAISIAILGLLLGLSVYLALPIRYLAQPEFNYAGTYDSNGNFHPVNLATFTGLWWLITGKSFAAQMFAYQGIELWREMTWYAGHLTRAFFGVGIGLGLIGLAVMARQNWRLFGMFALMFAVTAFFYIDYQVMDKETMFLPTYVVWAIWVAVGTDWLLHWVTHDSHIELQSGQKVIQGIAALILVAALVYTGPKVNLSDDWSTRVRGEVILSQAEPNAIILGWWDVVPVVQYLQLVENQRSDVEAINRFLISYEDLTAFVLQQADVRPIYIDEVPPTWELFFESQEVGQMNRLWVTHSQTEKPYVFPTKAE